MDPRKPDRQESPVPTDDRAEDMAPDDERIDDDDDTLGRPVQLER